MTLVVSSELAQMLRKAAEVSVAIEALQNIFQQIVPIAKAIDDRSNRGFESLKSRGATWGQLRDQGK